MSPSAIKAENLSKSFWKKKSWFAKKELIQAVKPLSFALHQGESVAILGPNGAGKSTIIKLLCGIIKPTTGQSRIAGHPSGSMLANRQLGLVFGARSNLWMFLTIRQSLEMTAGIYGLSKSDTNNRIITLSKLFEVSHLLDSTANSLSLGERMRCEIVAGLLHSPSILLADEPTIGLDIVGKARFRSLLKEWQEEEKITLILTSHDVSDVEALCDRAILINNGTIGYDGSLQGLKGDLSTIRTIQITLGQPIKNGVNIDIAGIRIIRDEELTKKFHIDTQTIAPTTAIDHFMNTYKDQILDITVAEINLESIITRWYSSGTKQ